MFTFYNNEITYIEPDFTVMFKPLNTLFCPYFLKAFVTFMSYLIFSSFIFSSVLF